MLQNVSFVAEPGQTIAIVGPTGAGKTTLINLIPRFYEATEGAVLIDGLNVRASVTTSSLREQIAIVLQDTFFFSTTVMENIRFGKLDARDEEVIEAAKLARADTFIERLSDGYQTVLGERGSGLSQGQRQLIAIARAALADPRILILDEATSSVDTRTERLIQQALNAILRERTSFVIAHRLSTMRNADLLLVLDKGQIVERGKHSELLAKKGLKEPIRFRTTGLDELALAPRAETKGSGTPGWLVFLADGNLWPARQVTVETGHVIADLAHVGQVRLERQHVAGVRRDSELVTLGGAPWYGPPSNDYEQALRYRGDFVKSLNPPPPNDYEQAMRYRDTKLPDPLLLEFPWTGGPISLRVFAGKPEDLHRFRSSFHFDFSWMTGPPGLRRADGRRPRGLEC